MLPTTEIPVSRFIAREAHIWSAAYVWRCDPRCQVGYSYIPLALLPFSLLLALANTLYILFSSPESDASGFDSYSFTTLPQVRDFCHED